MSDQPTTIETDPTPAAPATPAVSADRFVHLHSHSDYSVLDGLNDPYTLVRAAGHHGQPALALTDHGRLSGAVHFWDAFSWYNMVHAERHSAEACDPKGCHSVLDCRDNDRCPKPDDLKEARERGEMPVPGPEAHGTLEPIRGILGIETYVSHHGRKTREKGDVHHLVLLARDDKGWANLRALASRASIEGFYSKPRIDFELLREYSEGLIGLSACLGGHVATVLRESGSDAADAVIREYQTILGAENFYLELQWHLDQDLACARCEEAHEPGTLHDRPCARQQHDLNRWLIAASARLGAPLVMTNDLHYANRRDAVLEEVLLANQQRKSVSEIAADKAAGKNTLGFDTPDFYLKSRRDMELALNDWFRAAKTHDPQTAELMKAGAAAWLDATLEITDRVAYDHPFPDKKPKFPQFPVPAGETAESHLATLVRAKMVERYGDARGIVPERTARLVEYELQCVNELGFAPYFLITEDFVRYARAESIDVGLGRGSAPGSVVTYVLGITDVDPIAYGLTEGGIGLTRFLNPTVTYDIATTDFGALPATIAELSAPDLDSMEAELKEALNAKWLEAKAEQAQLNEEKLIRAKFARDLLVEEWNLIKRFGRTESPTRHSNLIEPLWRWLRHINAGGAPGDRNECHSLLAHFLGFTTKDARPLDPPVYDNRDQLRERGTGFLPFLPKYTFEHSRIGMPDIDIDFTPGVDGREKVMRYVADKYGHDHVCQIATFGTMLAKSALRDVARAKGFAPEDADALAKLIPDKFESTVDENGDEAPGVKLREIISSNHPAVVEGARPVREAMAADPRVAEVFNLAARLEGTRRTEGTHACGVLITPLPYTEYVSVRKVKESDPDHAAVQAVHDGPTLTDELGLLKVDFLGLKNLKVNRGTVERIAERRGESVDWIAVPDDDPAAMKLLRDGFSWGIFQFNSSFATGIIKQIKPRKVQDLMVATALGRPGPMDYIPDYVEARAKGKANYGDPVFAQFAAPILDETYGILVYQEQVMRLAVELCGFTLPESDGLRKATAKKDAAKLASFRVKFVEGAVAKGVKRDFIEHYWDAVLTPFAAYSFNKSHSTAYALTAYKQAYLKAHYLPEFMAALMTVDQSESKKSSKADAVAPIVPAVVEAKRMGLTISPVDINRSSQRIEIEGPEPDTNGKIDYRTGALRLSMAAIKGIGSKPVEAILAERTANGDFASFADFLERMVNVEKVKDPDTGRTIPNPVNKTVISGLIRVGAFDAFDDRNALLTRVEAYFKTASVKKRAAMNWSPTPGYDPDTIKPRDYLLWEKELLGFFASAHPADLIPLDARARTNTTVHEAATYDKVRDNEERIVAGVLRNLRYAPTKSGSGRYVAKLEDATAEVEFLYWKPKPGAMVSEQRRFAAFGEALASIEANAVLLTGRFSHHERYGSQFIVNDWELIELPTLDVAAAPSAAAEMEAKVAAAERVASEGQLYQPPAEAQADAMDSLLFGEPEPRPSDDETAGDEAA